MAPKTDPINTANPAGSSDPRLGDDYIRTLARAIVECMKVDHFMGASSPYTSDHAGKHEKVTFKAGYAGATTSGCMYISGDHSVQGSLCITNLSGNNIILTSGTQKVVNDSLLSHGQSIKSVAGSELVKCSGELIIVASGTLLARAITSADTLLAIPDKGYVDDQIDAHVTSGFTPETAGASDASLTLPSGHIIKFCSAEYAAGTTDWRHTFATPFPNGILRVTATPQGAASGGYSPVVSAKSASAIVIEWNGTTTYTMDVIAIGY